MTLSMEDFSVQLSQERLEKEKLRSQAMRANLRRRKAYQAKLKALVDKEKIDDQDSTWSEKKEA